MTAHAHDVVTTNPPVIFDHQLIPPCPGSGRARHGRQWPTHRYRARERRHRRALRARGATR